MRGRKRRGRGYSRHGSGEHAPPGYPLTMACSDEYVRVVRITTEHAAESRLVSMGINPGALLHVISASSHGPIVVARDETRFGIDRKTAWHVRVVPAQPSEISSGYPVFCDDDCRGCSYRVEMMKAEYGKGVTLSSLKPGERGTVISLRGRGSTVSRLMKMGFVKGEMITLDGFDEKSDLIIVSIQGEQLEIKGWDALHVVLEKDS